MGWLRLTRATKRARLAALWPWLAGGLMGVPGMVPADTSPLPAADYTVARSWPLGGNGSWDYLTLDPEGARLFVTRGDRVDVIETSSGRLTGSIQHTAGVHGVAFAPSLKRGFTSNGRSNTVSVFESDSLHVLQEVPVSGSVPVAILYEPHYNVILTANRESQNLSVIDAGTLQVVGTIALPGAPESMVADALGNVFVNINTAPGRLVMINLKTLSVKAKWPLPECANPTGLAIDLGGHRLFSVCANQVMAVTDSVTGKSIARVIIGRGADDVVYDAELGLVFSSNGIDGNLTVIQQESPDEYRVFATVTTQLSARTMAIDLGSHRIFLAAGQFGPTPAATPDNPLPRAKVVPDSFVILVAEPR